MKCFTPNGSFAYKINYVDASNRVLGYDMSRHCCEAFGHGVFAEIPSGSLTDAIPSGNGIDAYSFADEPPKIEDTKDKYGQTGGTAIFRIVANGLPDLFVILWNYQSGYYSHGWDWSGSLSAPVREGEL